MRVLRPVVSAIAAVAVAGVAVVATVPMIASAASYQVPKDGPFDVQIFDRTEGRMLPSYQFQGRTYVVGKPGNEYSISLRNRSGERVMAVTSVDGVNIVSGETASPNQSGYVLSPWQNADINGWRKSLNNTAAFYFTDLGDSYAARTGRPNNVGVIGVAVFGERRAVPVPAPVPYSYRYDRSDERSRSAQAYPSEPQSSPSAQPRGEAYADSPASPPPAQSGAGAAANQQSADARDYAPKRAEKSLGTGHGRIEDSRTRYTDFQRASSSPEQVVTIYYDTYNNLLAMGVPVWRDSYDDRYGRRDPRPFPRDPTLGFVPDPPRAGRY